MYFLRPLSNRMSSQDLTIKHRTACNEAEYSWTTTYGASIRSSGDELYVRLGVKPSLMNTEIEALSFPTHSNMALAG